MNYHILLLAPGEHPPVPLHTSTMSRHMDFIGQRADKVLVTEVVGIEEVEREDGIRREGVVKKVEHYTVTCDECGSAGYYDDHGEIVCDGCGMVLSGDRDPVINTEYSEGDNDSIGQGRGLEKMGTQQGTLEPSIDGNSNFEKP